MGSELRPNLLLPRPWMRLLECLLRVSYEFYVREWRAWFGVVCGNPGRCLRAGQPSAAPLAKERGSWSRGAATRGAPPCGGLQRSGAADSGSVRVVAGPCICRVFGFWVDDLEVLRV